MVSCQANLRTECHFQWRNPWSPYSCSKSSILQEDSLSSRDLDEVDVGSLLTLTKQLSIFMFVLLGNPVLPDHHNHCNILIPWSRLDTLDHTYRSFLMPQCLPNWPDDMNTALVFLNSLVFTFPWKCTSFNLYIVLVMHDMLGVQRSPSIILEL